ncbi:MULTISPECIES: type I restriction endonuclease [unclassified Microcystis]|uniref:type I restriction endonuclease n=1 Tax=unclassified Microcystis TaxID=2643300 RepID=UPI002580980B|nr:MULTISPECIES: type I restriction endonuclease [unclassified Microcystis]
MTTEDKVQELTANCLRDQLGWQSVYAYNQEDYGENSLLGRQNQKEVILKRYLKQKLREFNPNLPEEAYKSAILQIEEINSSQTLLATNQEKHQLLLDGVQVSYCNAKGELIRQTLKILDFDQPSNNHFLVVRELSIQGKCPCRPDLVGFVNGIPLLFLEAKNLNRGLKAAYEGNLSKYIDNIPHLFAYNAFAILVNGIDAKIGSFCGKYEHFHSWKRLAESDPGIVDMETMLKGVCDKNKALLN